MQTGADLWYIPELHPGEENRMNTKTLDRSLYGVDPRGESCEPAAAQKERRITRAQLPLCCPLPEECLWNAHPRVYLAIEAGGEAQCPYCGTRYRLSD